MDYETQHFILVALHTGRGMVHTGMLIGGHAHRAGRTQEDITFRFTKTERHYPLYSFRTQVLTTTIFLD